MASATLKTPVYALTAPGAPPGLAWLVERASPLAQQGIAHDVVRIEP